MTTSTPFPNPSKSSRPSLSTAATAVELTGDRSLPTRRPSRRGWFVFGAILVGVAAVLYFLEDRSGLFSRRREERPLAAAATRTTLPIVITAGGELESANAVDVLCQLEGESHKIVEMLAEGTHVTRGQVVIRLDPSAINDRLAPQQIKVTQTEATAKAAAEDLKIKTNMAASQVAQSELAFQIAELDRRKYLEGEYEADLSEMQGKIALGKAELQQARDTAEFSRTLVKKGFRTPEQLRAAEQDVSRYEYALRGHEKRTDVLERFTRLRQETELTAKAAEAKRELERAKSSAEAAVSKAQTDLAVAEATLRLERAQLNRIEQQREYCQIPAIADGTLVYAKEQNKRIELGGVVHYKQRLFSVPDMSRMQVKAFVHESEVKKVQPGMRAEIRVDALPNRVMQGTVREIATFYDSTRQWLSGGVKDYATIVAIEGAIDGSLKPGMTSQVNVFVGSLTDSLVVPITAVAEKQGLFYCFVVNDRGVSAREVAIGSCTDNFVEVRNGLDEGEQVVMDARRRVESLNRGKEDEVARGSRGTKDPTNPPR